MEVLLRELCLFPVTRVETTRSKAILGLKQLCKIMWLNVVPHTREFAFFATSIFVVINLRPRRLRWSRGCVLAFSTQVRGFKPGRSEKILSTTSFGREIKPLVPCRRFTACKRSLNVTWNSGISGKVHRPFLAHISSTFGC
jgi:hypothetical protein